MPSPSPLLHRNTAHERLLLGLSSGFGSLAVLLAGVGLYGTLGYAVRRRTRAIGIRLAFGAHRHAVLSMILSDALKLVALGNRRRGPDRRRRRILPSCVSLRCCAGRSRVARGRVRRARTRRAAGRLHSSTARGCRRSPRRATLGVITDSGRVLRVASLDFARPSGELSLGGHA